MSAADDLNLQEQIARIKRAQLETDKFAAEQHKLAAEQQKLGAEAFKLAAEQLKLAAEARKFDRERLLAPWQIAILLVGSVGGFFAGAVALWHTIVR